MATILNRKQIGTLHREAMKIVQRVILAEAEGRLNEMDVQAMYEKAFGMEKQVAMSLIEENHEPTRSVYFRSAASLAMNCNRFQEAKDLIKLGMTESTPIGIANEMLTVLGKVTQKEIELFRKQKKEELADFEKSKKEELKAIKKRLKAIAKKRAA